MYSQKADLWYCMYLWNYNTDQHEISEQYLDNENVSGDAVLWRHKNPRWRTAAILKIAKSPYLSEKSSDFDEIEFFRYWTRLQTRDQKLQFLKFKMAAAAILKMTFLAINHRPIVRF